MSGPFDTEDQARSLPAVRAAYDAAHHSPRRGVMTEHNHRMLCEAASAAGVELGAYDRRILQWLAGYEPQTCAVLAGIISRARPSRRPRVDGSEAASHVRPDGSAVISPGDFGTVLGALSTAAEYLRHQAGGFCPACADHPADLCDEHAAAVEEFTSMRSLSRALGDDR